MELEYSEFCGLMTEGHEVAPHYKGSLKILLPCKRSFEPEKCEKKFINGATLAQEVERVVR